MCIGKIEMELLPIYGQLKYDEMPKPIAAPDGAEKCRAYRILMKRVFDILQKNGFDFTGRRAQ